MFVKRAHIIDFSDKTKEAIRKLHRKQFRSDLRFGDLYNCKVEGRRGQYLVKFRLSASDMAEIYSAKDTDTSKDVIVKVPPGRGGTALWLSPNIHRERNFLQDNKHRGIVEIIDNGSYVGEWNGKIDVPFLVLEYLDGIDLHKFNKGHKLSVDEGLLVGREVWQVINDLHKKGVYLGDLKPGNIVLLRDGRVSKVVDFGLSFTCVGQPSPGIYGKSPRYSPPEVVFGNTFYNSQSEQFHLGVTLYEVFIGDSHLDQRDCELDIMQYRSVLSNMIRKIKESTLPPEIKSFMVKLLSEQPRERFDCSEEVLIALNDL